MDVPLPWERLLWSGRSLTVQRTRHVLTDFRLVSMAGRAPGKNDEIDEIAEIVLCDIDSVRQVASVFERLLGRSTLIIRPRNARRPPLVLRRIRRGEQLAGVLELLAGEPSDVVDPTAVQSALASTPWHVRPRRTRYREGVVGFAAVLALVFSVVIGLHGKSAPVAYPADDEIYPGGEKRDHASIVAFMETRVMPWARVTLGPIVGGSDRVGCDTCHGSAPAARSWQMPGVAELPKPDMAERGWERYSSAMDAQMRNAIYGYVAESDNQARAKYMREIVMPGMAALLGRPAYDFTKSYDFNRTHAAFGCYHCHRVQ